MTTSDEFMEMTKDDRCEVTNREVARIRTEAYARGHAEGVAAQRLAFDPRTGRFQLTIDEASRILGWHARRDDRDFSKLSTSQIAAVGRADDALADRLREWQEQMIWAAD